MAQPTPYVRLYNLTIYAAGNPAAPYNASQHDAEFDSIRTTLSQTLTNLALIQRDDGGLANSVVGLDSLSTAVFNVMGDWNPRGTWVTGRNYAVKDLVTPANSTISYVCAVAHTSGATFAADLAAGKWQPINGSGLSLFNSIVSVMDVPYGAAGDGITDDAAAIQSALTNSLPGSTVVMPYGTYRVSTGIAIPAGKQLVGLSYAKNLVTAAPVIVADLAVTPVVTMDGAAGANAVAIRQVGISRAAGTIPASCIGLLATSTDDALIEDVIIYRQDIGLKLAGQLGFSMIRVCTTQITGTHWWLEGSYRVRAQDCTFGKNGGLDVNCNEYVRIKGGGDTYVFTSCQMNLSAGNALRAFHFDTYTSANGLISLSQVHFEKCTDIVTQSGTASIPRMSFTDCTSNHTGQTFNVTAGVMSEVVMTGCNAWLGSTTFSGIAKMIAVGNGFLGPVVCNAVGGTFVANALSGNLTYSGLMTGFAHGLNALITPGATLTDTATGLRFTAAGDVMNDATLNPAVLSKIQSITLLNKLALASANVTYGPSMTIDASLGNIFIITVTDANAFTIQIPTNPTTGQEITIRMANTSGGATGLATWITTAGGFKMAAWVPPANANSRSIRFYYNGTNWIQSAAETPDVPN